MRGYIDHVLALLPFEPDVHKRLGGPPCTYVGHPLGEEAASLRPNEAEARRRMTDPPVVLAMIGSRSSEVKRLAGDFGDGAGARGRAVRAARRGGADRAPSGRSGEAGDVGLGRSSRASLSSRRRSSPPSGARGRRWRNPAPPRSSLRWRACRWLRPTRRSALEAEGGAAPGPRAIRHPRQSGDRRERRAGVDAGRLHAAIAGRRAGSVARRHAGAAPPARGLRQARCHHGDRLARAGRPRRRHRARTGTPGRGCKNKGRRKGAP